MVVLNSQSWAEPCVAHVFTTCTVAWERTTEMQKRAISLTSSLSLPELTELSELENGLVAFFLGSVKLHEYFILQYAREKLAQYSR